MKELAMTIHRSMGLQGEPSSLSLEQARRFSPIADALIRSHALSGDLARSHGWQPSRGSIMKDVEQRVSENVIVSRPQVATHVVEECLNGLVVENKRLRSGPLPIAGSFRAMAIFRQRSECYYRSSSFRIALRTSSSVIPSS